MGNLTTPNKRSYLRSKFDRPISEVPTKPYGFDWQIWYWITRWVPKIKIWPKTWPIIGCC